MRLLPEPFAITFPAVSGKLVLPIVLTIFAGQAQADFYWFYNQPEVKSIKMELRQASHDAFIAAVQISDAGAIRLLESAQIKGLEIRVLVEQPTPVLLSSNLKYVRVCKPGEIHNLSYKNGWKIIDDGPKKGSSQSEAGPHDLIVEGRPNENIPLIPDRLGSVMILDNCWTWNGPNAWSLKAWTGHSYGCHQGWPEFVPPLHELGLDEIWRNSRNARLAD